MLNQPGFNARICYVLGGLVAPDIEFDQFQISVAFIQKHICEETWKKQPDTAIG
ncbi:MAG: hypothetical protein HN394_21000 [Rhodospirillaceae bacterium]|nr:hypothetical protein [Rhodospirillaceae bacterium]